MLFTSCLSCYTHTCIHTHTYIHIYVYIHIHIKSSIIKNMFVLLSVPLVNFSEKKNNTNIKQDQNAFSRFICICYKKPSSSCFCLTKGFQTWTIIVVLHHTCFFLKLAPCFWTTVATQLGILNVCMSAALPPFEVRVRKESLHMCTRVSKAISAERKILSCLNYLQNVVLLSYNWVNRISCRNVS